MEDIIFITIAAVICGAETWNDIENCGKSKESWLRQYLQLPNGIPSDDTFNRFFSSLDPDEFEQAFLSWIKDISELTDAEVIGKGIRSHWGIENNLHWQLDIAIWPSKWPNGYICICAICQLFRHLQNFNPPKRCEIL